MADVKTNNPNTTKTGKPKYQSKSLEELQRLRENARPKVIPRINNAIAKKAGRGR